jgi:uncharacterized protein YjbJ (UPF0337 family)
LGSTSFKAKGAAQESKGDAQKLKEDTKMRSKTGVNKVADAADKKFDTGRSVVKGFSS